MKVANSSTSTESTTNHFQRRRGTVERYLSVGEGKKILVYYLNNQELNDYYRNKIVNIIINKEFETGLYENEKEFKITPERFHELTFEILNIFPTENKRTYYIPYSSLTKKLASGKLYEKLQTFKKGFRRARLSNTANGIAQQLNEPEAVETVNEDLQLKLEFIKKYIEPEQKVKEFWADTVEARTILIRDIDGTTIASYIDNFPILRSAEGYEYFKIDFDYYNKEKSNN